MVSASQTLCQVHSSIRSMPGTILVGIAVIAVRSITPPAAVGQYWSRTARPCLQHSSTIAADADHGFRPAVRVDRCGAADSAVPPRRYLDGLPTRGEVQVRSWYYFRETASK